VEGLLQAIRLASLALSQHAIFPPRLEVMRGSFCKLARARKEGIETCPHRSNYGLQRLYGWISAASFDARNICPIKFRSLSELFLTELRGKTEGPDGGADVACEIHAAVLGGCGPSNHGL